MNRLSVGLATIATATALLVSACSADDQTDADSTGAGTSTVTAPPAAGATSDAASESASESVPDEVVVHRPGAIDNNLTAEDLPAWPGPKPGDFLEPDPPSGERGTISGDDAAAVYRAAQGTPEMLLQDGQEPRDITGAIWWVDDHAEWLVVDPRW